MVCRNCGNEIRDDAKFCPHCGMANNSGPGSGLPQGAAPYSGAATPAWEGPESGKKKTGLFIGIGIAAAAVIALLVFVVSGMFGSPKGTMEKAFLKSSAAYQAAAEKLGMPDVAQWQKDQTINQRMNLELKSINSDLVGMDLSALNGLALGMSANYDGTIRNMSLALGACWGDDELFTFQMGADDDELYFNSPQLTGETYYGLNTETLGADLAKSTGDDSVRDISFNLFDLVDMVLEEVDQEAMEKRFQEANKALWEQAAVKKTGARTLSINGTETKTTAYHVTIPQEALDQYVDNLEALLSVLNYYDLYQEIYQSMGMSQEQIDEILSILEEYDIYGELADALRDAVEDTGDLELDVCLSDGYVSAVLYEGRVGGSDVEVSVYLGGGEEYVDDLSVDITTPSGSVDVKSTGDHGLKSGVYTDDTTIRVREDNRTLARVTSEMSIDPSKEMGNFQWKLGVDSSGLSVFVLETSGDYDVKDTYLFLDLEDMSLRVMGMEVCTLAFDYYVDCLPSTIAVIDPRMVTQMSEQELEQVGADIQGKAAVWLLEMQQLFTSRLPEELLWAIMSEF